MEELLVYAILLYEDIVTEDMFQERLDALFLEHLDNGMLLDLECETDIQKALIRIRTQFDYLNMDTQKFGIALVRILKDYYARCLDIRQFGHKMYSLWESLPGQLQNEEPFWSLSYADDPLSWGDETQTRFLYEKMLAYYDKKQRKEDFT